MKVGRPVAGERPDPLLGTLAAVVLALIVFAAGLAAGAAGWHRAILGSVSQVLTRVQALPYRQSLPALAVDIGFEDYNQLLRQRQVALERGVHVTEDDGFVPATLSLGGQMIRAEIQLREGPAAHLGVDDRWPFQVRAASDLRLGGLPFENFVLEDPAENNYLMQWAFAEALRSEGLLAPRYRFVDVILNGADEGLYVVRESLSETYFTAQGRRPGVVVGYDTAPLWEAVGHFGGSRDAALSDPVSSLSLTDVSAFGVKVLYEGAMSASEGADDQPEQAVALLRAVQIREGAAPQILDLTAYGRFLALADLWSAGGATSPVNLSYYYDAESDKLEPIATEGNPLATEDRLPLEATYGDPRLQKAYVEEATLVAQPDYLEWLEQTLKPEWTLLSAQLAGVVPDQDPPWNRLAERQEMLRQSLNPVEPILAYVSQGEDAAVHTLQFDIANRLSLPVEVLGFDIGGATFVNADSSQLAVGTSGLLPGFDDGIVLRGTEDVTYIPRFTRFRLSLADIQEVDDEASFDRDMVFAVAVRLLGSRYDQIVAAVPDEAQGFGTD